MLCEYVCGKSSCIAGSGSGITLTDGRGDGRNKFVGVSRGPGPELEYSNGTDSKPQRGSIEGCRDVAVVPPVAAVADFGETGPGGGDDEEDRTAGRLSSINDGGGGDEVVM